MYHWLVHKSLEVSALCSLGRSRWRRWCHIQTFCSCFVDFVLLRPFYIRCMYISKDRFNISSISKKPLEVLRHQREVQSPSVHPCRDVIVLLLGNDERHVGWVSVGQHPHLNALNLKQNAQVAYGGLINCQSIISCENFICVHVDPIKAYHNRIVP